MKTNYNVSQCIAVTAYNVIM